MITYSMRFFRNIFYALKPIMYEYIKEWILLTSALKAMVKEH